jgi:pimeloyl-ACP methyl ester carboxylesterase
VTRTCAYDRAGLGWSEAGPLPRTAGRIADELYELLRRGAVPGPYLLVGHSYGGLVMRFFALRHAADVAGLVLIEPAIPEQWAQPVGDQLAEIERGRRLCRYGMVACRSGVARAVALLVKLRAVGAARAIARIFSRGGLRREDEGILAPIWKLPPQTRRILGRLWTQEKFYEALASQIEHVSRSATDLLNEQRGDFDALPLAVISSAAAGHRLAADAALARRSSRGRHVLAADSGHWVPLDAPQVVIDTIVDLVDEVRGTS